MYPTLKNKRNINSIKVKNDQNLYTYEATRVGKNPLMKESL